MIIELMPYPAMRDSGVEWLGKVPEHWEVRRLKMLSRREQNGSTPSMEHPEFYTDEGLPWYGPPSLGEALSVGRPSRYVSKLALEQSKVRAIIPPALAVSVIGNVGRCALLLQPGATNQQITCFELVEKLCVPRFVARQFRLAEKSLIASASSATISILDSTVVRGTPLVLPPLPEQNAIVRYLDYVDRRVRRLTRAKQKLVALLTEQKQAIIHRAVTRGLDPNVPMKDSGVEWLGEVPRHWKVMRLKHWVGINKQTLSETTGPAYEFDYIDIGSVTTGRLTTNPERIQFANAPSRARRVVQTEDTIVSTVRTYLKAVWHAEEPVDNLIASTGFAILTPNSETSPKFVSCVAQSDVFTNRVTAESVGIAYPAIAETKLSTFEVAIPPLPEQAAIVEYLDQATVDIDAAIARANREIELLDEYRTRLIADVVTGKLDVREAAAALPEVDPLEMEEESP